MVINSDRVAWKVVGDELVVIDLETNMQYIFNQTSKATWLSLAEGADSVDGVATKIQSQFCDVPDQGKLHADISGFLDDMVSKGLICNG